MTGIIPCNLGIYSACIKCLCPLAHRTESYSASVLQRKHATLEELGFLPFTQRFQYFRMDNKWNTHFGRPNRKINGINGLLEKVVLFDRLERFNLASN